MSIEVTFTLCYLELRQTLTIKFSKIFVKVICRRLNTYCPININIILLPSIAAQLRADVVEVLRAAASLSSRRVSVSGKEVIAALGITHRGHTGEAVCRPSTPAVRILG